MVTSVVVVGAAVVVGAIRVVETVVVVGAVVVVVDWVGPGTMDNVGLESMVVETSVVLSVGESVVFVD